MQYLTPPHEVRDTEKLQNMIRAIRNGKELPPVVAYAGVAYCGSHRIAAWEETETQPAVIELTEDELLKAICKMQGWEYDPEFDDKNEILSTEIYDYNAFCEAIYDVTDREEVKQAVAGQF